MRFPQDYITQSIGHEIGIAYHLSEFIITFCIFPDVSETSVSEIGKRIIYKNYGFVYALSEQNGSDDRDYCKYHAHYDQDGNGTVTVCHDHIILCRYVYEPSGRGDSYI